MINYYGNEITWVPRLEEPDKPIYILIAQSIEKDIKDGKLKSGFKLPPQRIIANYLGINHSTVTRAYKLCQERGLIKGVIGKGTFVSSTAGVPVNLLSDYKDNNIIEMGMALPLYEVNKLIETNISEIFNSFDYDITLKYSSPEGHIKHRYIASKWLEQYKINSTPDDIIITSGSQNALAVILISLFNKGDRIIVDEFTYTGLKSLAKLLGIILIPVKGDHFGIDIEELKKTCKRENAKGVYLIPDCHNPTSITLSEEKRRIIGEIITKYNLLLIEDGTFSFSLEKKLKPMSSLIPNNSIYIHGTSKALNPTFRISYIVSSPNHTKQLQHCLHNLTWMPSPFTSELVSLLQTTSKYNEIVDAKLKILKERNELLDTILNEYNVLPSNTSLFRYLILPNEWSDTAIERLCLESGIQVFSSKRFSIGADAHHNAIRISVSAPRSSDELKKGLQILKDVLTSYEYRLEPILY
ncbi:PLP-dependent aminotransferase family protein [Clostridium sp. MSJ-11]|uniref:PLP-dependent aminotransferase family protein n=1 Tax=Clostridium mobile TaxID=2841512 RepID=A0ABS6EPK2_9CLOT|nr:PLP-dependent aminotransferase family protein [Clostridium mobile]MBU5486309.1 PLP-dependent aminotransferase family protein [Clostridium mobile]